jgi:hypothetical protein
MKRVRMVGLIAAAPLCSVSSREGNVCRKIVKDRGTIICAAECRDGIQNHGSDEELLMARASPGEMLDMIVVRKNSTTIMLGTQPPMASSVPG